MTDIVVGVDAGGSKTHVLVATEDGRQLASVVGPGARMAPGDAEHCADVIAGLVAAALEEAERTMSKGVPAAPIIASAVEDVAANATALDEGDDSDDPYLDESETDDDMDAEDDSAADGADDDGEDDSEDDESEESLDADSDEETVTDTAADTSASTAPKYIASTYSPSSESSWSRPSVLYVGASGAGREAERVALLEALQARGLADETVVETDVELALADAFNDGAGVVLVAGTGSIAYGRSPAGVIARCGGWGFAFGDEGSGAWIGRRALNVVAGSHDGREPETALTGAILTAAQVNEVEQLIPWAIAAGPADFATLAPVVLAAASSGDLRASSIVDVAVEELMLHVRALSRRLFMDERASFGVALTGGLLTKGSLVRKRLEKRLKHAVPGAEIRAEPVIGARGAIKRALQALVTR